MGPLRTLDNLPTKMSSMEIFSASSDFLFTERSIARCVYRLQDNSTRIFAGAGLSVGFARSKTPMSPCGTAAPMRLARRVGKSMTRVAAPDGLQIPLGVFFNNLCIENSK